MRFNKLLILCVGIVIGVVATASLMPRPADPTPFVGAATAAERALDRPLPVVEMDGVPLADALHILKQLWGVPVEARWEDLLAEEVVADTPIYLRGKGITLAAALDEILGQAGGGGRPVLVYTAGEDGITIGTESHPPRGRPVLRAYDVADLLDGEFTARAGAAGADPMAGLLSLVTEAALGEDFDRTPGDYLLRGIGTRIVLSDAPQSHRRLRILLAKLREKPPADIPPAGPPHELLVWDTDARQWVSANPGRAEVALRMRVGVIDWDGVALEQVVRTLRERTGAPIVVDWSELSSVTGRELPVTLRLDNPMLWEVLARLDTQRTWTYRPAFILRGEVIVLTSYWVARATPITRVYDIRDWLHKLRMPIVTTGFDPEASITHAGHGRRGTFVGELILLVGREIADRPEDALTPAAAPVIEHNGRLVVSAAWEDHERVEALLNTLRAGGTGPASPQPPGGGR